MTDSELDAVAGQVALALRSGMPLQPFSVQRPDFDTAAGYGVATRLRQQRVAAGARVVGRKIGFTNRALWPVYGVDRPIWGAIYDDTRVRLDHNRGRCSLAGLQEPKIEPEIVLHFASAPQPDDSAADLLQRIDLLAHAFEIVHSPYPGWTFGTADAVAVGSLHGLLLVGTPVPVAALGSALEAALASFKLTLACNGKAQDHGNGANVLGSPLQAALHLVRALAQQPASERIQGDEWITTGTLTAAWPVSAGQTWSTQLDGLELPGLSVDFHP